MNRYCRLLLLLPLLCPVLASAQDATVAALVINGRPVDADAPAMLVDGHVLIPASLLNSELGMTVETVKDVWHLRAYGSQLALRPGAREYTLGDTRMTSAVAPVLRGDDLLVPVGMLVTPLGLTLTHDDKGWQLTSPPAGVLEIRQGTHKDRVRFVVDVTAPASFRWYEEPGKLMIELFSPPDPEGRDNVLRLHEFEDAFASQVTETTRDCVTRLVITHESTEPPVLFTLNDPCRIVVDLLREPVECPAPPKPQVALKPHPGDLWSSHAFMGSKGAVRGYVIRFNPIKTGWTLRPALAASTIMQRSRVSSIAARHDAYGAINGGFFAKNGPPLGMLVIDGEWIKAPLYSRAVLGITKNGGYAIANVDFEGQVDFECLGFLPLESLNEGHDGADSLVAFTPRWGPLVSGAPGKTRLAIGSDGRVLAVYPANTDVPMPEGGFVLSGNGRRAETLSKVPQGTHVKLNLQTAPRWPDLRHAIGGGPMLVQNGKLYVNGHAERFRADVTNSCRPRSAVGLTATGEVILLAVQDPGMTLTDLANTMIKLGAAQAMNLDGGGSTAIVVEGKLLNDPSDGCERPVSNAVLVVKE